MPGYSTNPSYASSHKADNHSTLELSTLRSQLELLNPYMLLNSHRAVEHNWPAGSCLFQWSSLVGYHRRPRPLALIWSITILDMSLPLPFTFLPVILAILVPIVVRLEPSALSSGEGFLALKPAALRSLKLGCAPLLLFLFLR